MWTNLGVGCVLPGELGTVAWTKDCETYPKQCAQNIKKTGTLSTVFSVCILPLITAFFFSIRFEKTYPFPLKCCFSDPKRLRGCALPTLIKSTLSHRFLFNCSSISTKLTSQCRPPPRPPPRSGEQMYCPVWSTLTAYRPPAALCPCFFVFFYFFTSCFCPILPSCKNM